MKFLCHRNAGFPSTWQVDLASVAPVDGHHRRSFKFLLLFQPFDERRRHKLVTKHNHHSWEGTCLGPVVLDNRLSVSMAKDDVTSPQSSCPLFRYVPEMTEHSKGPVCVGHAKQKMKRRCHEDKGAVLITDCKLDPASTSSNNSESDAVSNSERESTSLCTGDTGAVLLSDSKSDIATADIIGTSSSPTCSPKYDVDVSHVSSPSHNSICRQNQHHDSIRAHMKTSSDQQPKFLGGCGREQIKGREGNTNKWRRWKIDLEYDEGKLFKDCVRVSMEVAKEERWKGQMVDLMSRREREMIHRI
ncbi:hypothetical protein PR048_027426 [Dryococelus australis]|uniref:Uncharacterized protein n=1 Tax=Dryococelus australis TaxID=614101 RepID=A0ABQ9GGG0_9NEOP|nr:hypothetical protein PR048_027426 [Dryococelus australis]